MGRIHKYKGLAKTSEHKKVELTPKKHLVIEDNLGPYFMALKD